jgi:putative ABC transport system substrate-binding protein
MKRREFIRLIAGAATAWPLATRAQQPRKNPRLAILLFNSPQIDPIGPLLKGLRELGYVDGKSIGIEYRYAEGKADRLPGLASELVQLKPDVIFAYGGDVAPHAKRATASIPSWSWSVTIPCKVDWFPASTAPVETSRELP